MTYREGVPHCMTCRHPLEPMVVTLKAPLRGSFDLLACDRCGSLWAEGAMLLDFIRAVKPDKHIDELMVLNYEDGRRRCPVCKELMDMAWLDNLQLDQCAQHGVWLDRGELQKIARWDIAPPPPAPPRPRR